MSLQRLKDWLDAFGGWLAPREEIVSSRILPEGATLVLNHIAEEELGRIPPAERGDVDAHLDYIVHNPALNDGPATHNKAPIVHRYAGGFLYCYMYGLSRMILAKFGRLMFEEERRGLRGAKDFSVMLLRVIRVPEAAEVAARMDDIPEECRDVVQMRFLKRMSIDAITDSLRSTPTSIKRILVRAQEVLGDSGHDYQPIPLDTWRLPD